VGLFRDDPSGENVCSNKNLRADIFNNAFEAIELKAKCEEKVFISEKSFFLPKLKMTLKKKPQEY